MIADFLRPAFHHFGGNLNALLFRFMKIVPAVHVVDQALSGRHKRSPGIEPSHYQGDSANQPKYVIETSSGTALIALAYACHAKGIPLVGVGDHAIEPALQAQVKALGAELHLVDSVAGSMPGGFQKARLEMLHNLLTNRPGGYWTKQYDNSEWKLGYYNVAAQSLREFGAADVLVCPTGSGASSAGLSEAIRFANPRCKLVGVDTIGSVLFGAPEGPRRLRGVGLSILPGNLRREYFDAIHWVSAEFAWTWTYRLFREHGVPGGPTTGASYAVASHIAAQHPGQRVVFLGPDDSKRYEPKVFSEDLLKADNLWLDQLPDAPNATADSDRVSPGHHWWCMEWNRRS
jgi:cysteine synthase